LPQWNCACTNCGLAREGKIPARTQSSVAISSDGKSWFLINASPDLRAQIESFPALQPAPASTRNSPIAGVLLTNADLDHVLGLFLLREAGQLSIFSPRPVLDVLALDLRLTHVLRPFCQINYYEPSTEGFAPLAAPDAQPGDLRVRAIPLSAKPPPFSTAEIVDGTQSVAYEIIDERTKGRIVVAPDVARITPELRRVMEAADAVLFDGTFWSNLEFEQITGKKRTADDMGHLPIEGSLNVLRKLKAQHKIYFHINNTNPILAPGSKERAAVEAAGVTVGHDGLEFEL
jgi:pyrroloquinoline quinone biosynthesis protein B